MSQVVFGEDFAIRSQMYRLLTSAAFLVPVALVVQGIGAQQPVQAPAFDAVSIKRSPPDAGAGVAGPRPGGRFVMVNGPTRVLINSAYQSQSNEIVGAPDWVTYENYDVTATAGREVDYDGLTAMLRTMLADRFKLVARYEFRERPVYALVLARADGSLGPRMRRSANNCAALEAERSSGGRPAQPPAPDTVAPCTVGMTRGSIVSAGFTMSGLAMNLSRPAGRVVIDRTGLSGDYDFTLDYAPEPGADGLPSLFTALQEQLGLKLEPSRAPVQVVVVDRIERPAPD